MSQGDIDLDVGHSILVRVTLGTDKHSLMFSLFSLALLKEEEELTATTLTEESESTPLHTVVVISLSTGSLTSSEDLDSSQDTSLSFDVVVAVNGARWLFNS